MLVQNVEPRLIVVGGVFIAPNATVEVSEKAEGLSGFIERGVLVKIEPPKAEPPKAEKKEAK